MLFGEVGYNRVLFGGRHVQLYGTLFEATGCQEEDSSLLCGI